MNAFDPSNMSPRKRYFLRVLELAKTDGQIGALMPKEELREKASQSGMTLERVMGTYLQGYGHRSALGGRKYEVHKDLVTQKNIRRYLSEFSTISYRTLLEKTQAIAMAWRKHPFCRVRAGDFVGIMGFTSVDFTLVDFACAFAQAVSVPLQSSTSGADLGEIFSNVQPVMLSTTFRDLPLAVQHAKVQKSIKTLLVFNYDPRIDEEKEQVAAARRALKESDTELISLSELIAFGKEYLFSYLPDQNGGQERMSTIMHSSGSTGKPKGAVISQRAMINTWTPRQRAVPRISLMMAPLNHFMGRVDLINTLKVGGTAYFTLKPDLSSVFEDIRLSRPTNLAFFPRIFELIHQHFQNEVARRTRDRGQSREVIAATVQAEMKNTFLGDRLLFGTVGSAPTSPKVKAFIRDCFDILLIEGYGNTEAGSGSLTLDERINRKVVIDYKLRDVPELGYYTSDKPYPRGELCVKTKFGVKEYYKQPDVTAGLNDADGYNLTGDIVEERGPDHVVVIDRRKDVLKLSQGEYVAVGPLGTVFEAGSALIKQIYVYGNSLRSYLLAVIVPEREIVQKELGKDWTDSQLKNLIRRELQGVGEQEGLKSFEIPRDFIIEKEPFSQKNGLLSSVRKRLRPALKRKYGLDLEAIYERHQQYQEAEMKSLKDPDSPLSVREKLIKILENNLGVKDIETEEDMTFNQLGGDSLGASLFSLSIEEIFGVSIGADVILSPNGHIDHWVQLIGDLKEKDVARPSFNLIHGKGAQTVKAADLQLIHFLDPDLIDRAAALPAAPAQPKRVLLTGANGFLGHILCLHWLEELAKTNGKLICLVRGKDDSSAKRRLDDRFSGLDPELEMKYKLLSEKHLEVLSGDIAQPLLGLTEEVFDRLSREVDRICHPAALVNHRLSYPHLFRPNVVGTAELIRLSITDKRKPLDFISTVGVQPLLDKRRGNHEKAPLKSELHLTDRYAEGYATSKWAAEHLLHKAHNELGLLVNIFRCNMILPHRQYSGQINQEDMLTRLLYSLILTEMAPESFYQAEEEKPQAHYDGIPVDVLATAIVGLCRHSNEGCTTFNAYNYLQDSVSLDSFVEWIISAGYKLDAISDFSNWVDRTETKLKSMSASQRQSSMLDIMDAYSQPIKISTSFPDCSNFQTLFRALSDGADIPHLSEAYLHKYLRDMVLTGLIPTPEKLSLAR